MGSEQGSNECFWVSFLQMSWFRADDVLGNSWDGATLPKFPPGQGCDGDPVGAGEERFLCCRSTSLSAAASRVQSLILCSRLRCGDSGEDPDQSQQRPETGNSQDIQRGYAKGNNSSLHKRD